MPISIEVSSDDSIRNFRQGFRSSKQRSSRKRSNSKRIKSSKMYSVNPESITDIERLRWEIRKLTRRNTELKQDLENANKHKNCI